MANSLADFCLSNPPNDWTALQETSRAFLLDLNLPAIHPLCDVTLSNDYYHDTIDLPKHLFLWPQAGWWQSFLTTVVFQTAIPLMALIELWLRLLSGYVAPIGILSLWWWRQQHSKDALHACRPPLPPIRVSLTTLAASIVIMTDSNYVYEYGGPLYGICLFVISLWLASYCLWSTGQLDGQRSRGVILLSLLILCALFLTWDGTHFQFGAPHDVDIQIKPGLYYNQGHSWVVRAMDLWGWAKTQGNYTEATPWILTGDGRTGLPYLWNQPPQPDYYTVYLTTHGNTTRMDDDDKSEIVAVAFAFPVGGYQANTTLFLVLHGMNGGIQDGYIQDLIARRTAAGSTVAVLMARGLHGMPLVSGNIFSVARTLDVHILACAIRRVHKGPLAGIGYSIGAIVLAHYVTSAEYNAGGQFPLDAAFSISGSLECRQEALHLRPQRLWQPMIADHYRKFQYLQQNKLYPTAGHALHRKLTTRDQVLAFQQATHVVSLDMTTIVPFYNYTSYEEYYAASSALGDVSVADLLSPDLPKNVYHSQLARHLTIPLGVLHGLDDPISTWHTNAGNTGWLRPENLVQLNPNLVLLLTRKGGHVGWPLSWRPWKHGWEFMNEAASTFVEAVLQAKLLGKTTNNETCSNLEAVVQAKLLAKNDNNESCSTT